MLCPDGYGYVKEMNGGESMEGRCFCSTLQKTFRIFTDILWRVCHISTEPVLYTFVSVNRNVGARFHYSVDLRIQTCTEPQFR